MLFTLTSICYNISSSRPALSLSSPSFISANVHIFPATFSSLSLSQIQVSADRDFPFLSLWPYSLYTDPVDSHPVTCPRLFSNMVWVLIGAEVYSTRPQCKLSAIR